VCFRALILTFCRTIASIHREEAILLARYPVVGNGTALVSFSIVVRGALSLTGSIGMASRREELRNRASDLAAIVVELDAGPGVSSLTVIPVLLLPRKKNGAHAPSESE